jgi:MerR family transcriptional regulator, thiopeptide resistance regulator
VARMWSVGELARATGVSVRALHHYDEIGLLTPSERTAAGHRRYGDDDLRRLYRIVALRGLGLGLAEIGGVLADAGDLRAAVNEHVERVDAQAAALARLRGRLVGIRNALDRGGASAEQIIDVIEEMRMAEQYYTPEQLERLRDRAREIGDEAIAAAEREWPQLIAAVEAERAKGTDPADPRVQELAARWRELVEQFTGGDAGIASSLKSYYDDHPNAHGMSPELGEYVRRAWEAGG